METPLDSGDALWTIQLNSVVQAYTRQAYHISGGQVNPGTSATQMTVAVEAGEGRINDQGVSWADEEVILAGAGVGPDGTDQNEPRVDVVYAQRDGTLTATTGIPAPFAPDTRIDDNGNEVPYTPSPFEHWEPAPDDGGNVGGLVLGFVLILPGWSSAQDMSTAEIKQWKLGGAGAEQFIRGDGVDNGPVNIDAHNAPVTIGDPSLGEPDYFDYDPDSNTLKLGAAGALPILGGRLDARGNQVVDVQTVRFEPDEPINTPALNFADDDNGDRVLWKMGDGSPNDPETWIMKLPPGGAAGDIIQISGPNGRIFTMGGGGGITLENRLDANGSPVNGASFFGFETDGQTLYTNPDGNLIYQDQNGDIHTIAGPTA
jgi:hypothetical protein